MPKDSEETLKQVQEMLKGLALKTSDYDSIKQSINRSMESGLKIKEREQSSIKMYPSFVVNIPNGSEKGSYLALDLGGTNYRVILAQMSGDAKPPIIDERTYVIPPEYMHGSGDKLFEFIANTLHEFLKNHGLLEQNLKLGFTFSFPCEQSGLDKSILVRWTKGFDVDNVVGKNICELLQNAINKLHLKVKCTAVVNDTVGTLTSCALEDSRCAIGLIIGTGTNAAYLEKVKAIQTIDASKYPEGSSMIINTEWGAFGEKGELDKFLTEYDKQLDKDSLHPGKQIFEKMCSGSYLGEIVRLALLDLIGKKMLFGGKVPDSLKNANSFLTKYITETERDPPHLFYSTQYLVSEDLKVSISEPLDFKIVRLVCELVSTRAAHLIGTGLAALLQNLNREKVTIGIDGSLYKFHPKFSERMTDIIDALKTSNNSFFLKLSEDGSGKGAAAIVAAASRN